MVVVVDMVDNIMVSITKITKKISAIASIAQTREVTIIFAEYTAHQVTMQVVAD